MTHPALDHIWASLPVPAILLDDQDCIAEINSAAEGFLNASNKSVQGFLCLTKSWSMPR